ncbi:MAG TPA: hypothetical protein VF181_09990 [Balneolaceae bacterium]
MEALNGATIFWLITLGMIAGALVKVVMWKSTVDIVPNIVFGVLGTLIVGGITISLSLPGGLLFAFIGTLAILFIINVFNQPESSPEATH